MSKKKTDRFVAESDDVSVGDRIEYDPGYPPVPKKKKEKDAHSRNVQRGQG